MARDFAAYRDPVTATRVYCEVDQSLAEGLWVMVIRIGTWNLENLFKPPNPFAPKTEEGFANEHGLIRIRSGLRKTKRAAPCAMPIRVNRVQLTVIWNKVRLRHCGGNEHEPRVGGARQ